MIDDLIHEIAHSNEEMYQDIVYTDGKLEDEFSDKVNFHRINIQSKKGKILAKQYNVTVVPTFIFINKAGKIVYKKSGLIPQKTDFIALINE